MREFNIESDLKTIMPYVTYLINATRKDMISFCPMKKKCEEPADVEIIDRVDKGGLRILNKCKFMSKTHHCINGIVFNSGI